MIDQSLEAGLQLAQQRRQFRLHRLQRVTQIGKPHRQHFGREVVPYPADLVPDFCDFLAQLANALQLCRRLRVGVGQLKFRILGRETKLTIELISHRAGDALRDTGIEHLTF